MPRASKYKLPPPFFALVLGGLLLGTAWPGQVSAGKLNERIYCDGAVTDGIGSVSSDQFWALGANGQMNRIEVNVYSNYDERVYIQVFKQNGFYDHVHLRGIASSHTFMMNESNPPVEIRCRAAKPGETDVKSYGDGAAGSSCARVGGLDAGAIIKKETLEDRDALRDQIRSDMERYRRLKGECDELAKSFRERANVLKETLRNFTRRSAVNAAEVGALNQAVVGAAGALAPTLGAAKATLQQRQRVPYVVGSQPPPPGSAKKEPPRSNRVDPNVNCGVGYETCR